jgi:CDP-diacylglycerol--serine O-phosphatidyltransferase
MVVLKHIPNTITLLNLFSGCTGIVFVSMGYFRLAAICIVVSAVFDFFDGMAARALKVYSAIGKDLDSLADVVSFGVLPSFMVFSFLKKVDDVVMINRVGYGLPFDGLYLVVFIMAVFSALRLARFNHDSGQEISFRGLPTPANGLFWASVFLGLGNSSCIQKETSLLQPDFDNLLNAFTDTACSLWTDLLLNKYFVLLLSAAMAFLLVAPVRLLSFKLKSWGWKENKYRYLWLAFSISAALWLGFEAAPIILLLYFVFSFFTYRKSYFS